MVQLYCSSPIGKATVQLVAPTHGKMITEPMSVLLTAASCMLTIILVT